VPCRLRGGGSIINISSTYGHRGAAYASIYVGAKHAVEGNHQVGGARNRQLGNSGETPVGPGPTDTGMLTRFTGTAENKAALVTQVPLGRLVLSEEVADGIVFLGSDEGRFITGHVLNVDGGHNRQLILSGRNYYYPTRSTRNINQVEGVQMANVVKKQQHLFRAGPENGGSSGGESQRTWRYRERSDPR